MLTKPRTLLHLEGGALLVLAAYLYHTSHFSWRLFALFFLWPDLAMLGYLRSAKLGSALYNSVHTFTCPVLLLIAALSLPAPAALPYALLWISHIGFDRLLGYGLKYPTFFKDTHLQHVSRQIVSDGTNSGPFRVATPPPAAGTIEKMTKGRNLCV